MRYVRWLREYERDSHENGPVNGLCMVPVPYKARFLGSTGCDRVGYVNMGRIPYRACSVL